ncbi:hypothetical protein CEXT_412441 [Caerostris extrusa]|uniref:Uncharacterized protein n=1 Tax=Caerostris extrusa TaxID=172846 RepID=A0AAV4SWM0_CAEEX|nr:hypothetical protein CEXT_412441 [Caerostris extrusa]
MPAANLSARAPEGCATVIGSLVITVSTLKVEKLCLPTELAFCVLYFFFILSPLYPGQVVLEHEGGKSGGRIKDENNNNAYKEWGKKNEMAKIK